MQDKEEESNIQEFKPRKLFEERFYYPWEIKLFALLVVSLLTYALIMLPDTIRAARYLNRSIDEYNASEYAAAKYDAEQALILKGNSQKARLYIALACFKTPDPYDDKYGISYLPDIQFNETDWEKLVEAAPPAYQKYFPAGGSQYLER
jgi:hypothetical protein